MLCEPSRRIEFDEIAHSIAPDVSPYRLRKAALGLRKARRLQPEIVKRIASWECEILTFDAEALLTEPDLIPRKPGVYLLRDQSGYLYIDEAGSLRTRVVKHLDHSDRKNARSLLLGAGNYERRRRTTRFRSFIGRTQDGSSPRVRVGFDRQTQSTFQHTSVILIIREEMLASSS